MKDKKRILPLPEAVVGERGDTEGGRWTVQAGSSQRGQAFTDFGSKRMVAPVVDDEIARLIRNHELTHARISPANEGQFELLSNTGLSERVIHCAEEYRVNTVLKGLGYDIDLLSDGSEGKSGERLSNEGTVEAWNEAVAFSTALLGTKAYNRFIAGIRKHQPEWAVELKTIGKEVKKSVGYAVDYPELLGSTEQVEVGTDSEGNPLYLPAGFDRFTRHIATQLQRSLRVPSSEAEREFKDSIKKDGGKPVDKKPDEKYGVGYGKDVFAPLILDNLPLTIPVAGYVKQKRKASNIGKAVKHPDRIMTDPYRRVFTQKRKVKGGIVVIDQSGSMEVTQDDLEQVLKEVPGALVIGYSHRPNSTDGTPNAWVLAKNGKRVKEVRDGNVGNGVDGPVLDYALSQRKGNEPVIWVCDGQVTGANDRDNDGILTRAVGNTVRRHGIIQVRELNDAPEALRNPSKYRGKYFGRVGRFLDNK